MCLEVGRWEEAIHECQVLLSLAPRSLPARDVLSAAYLQRGLIEKALQVTEEMITLDPHDAAHHFKRGVLLQQQGMVGPALREFQRVLQMDADGEAAAIMLLASRDAPHLGAVGG
jgi:tetratricopeptide (TPR) repeat protein